MTSAVSRHTTQQFLADGGTEDVLHHLVRRYTEPHRRYHGLDHVLAVVKRTSDLCGQYHDDLQLELERELKPGTKRELRLTAEATKHFGPASVARLAAWFHDAVYDPHRPDNEALSAELAIAQLATSQLSETEVQTVAQLVRMTQHHQPESLLGAVLADADLWTLGGPTEEYLGYGALIRAEYAHVSPTDWRAGRGAFIARFLKRPQIFHTAIGQAEREAQARHNLQTELEFLQV
jgi:predicted metal-dependent HD superfamily phosphohydrolase